MKRDPFASRRCGRRQRLRLRFNQPQPVRPCPREGFDVAPTTKLASAQTLGYWRFTLTTGAQVAYAEDAVQRVELGNIEFADDRGRVSAEGAEAP